jgi:hypothetical protein
MNFHASNSRLRNEDNHDVEIIAKPPIRPETVLDYNACLVDGTARRRSGLEKTAERFGAKEHAPWWSRLA